jgi:hypothetical protein
VLGATVRMTQLRVKQISSRLRILYEPFLDLLDIGATDKGRDDKVLSRCLAAHAVFMQTECSAEEAARSVWDGLDDNGIDAVFADEADDRVIVVQAKWINAGSGEPSSADIGRFADGVRDLVEQNSGNFHPRLQSRLADAGQTILTPGCTIEIVLVSTGASKLAKHGTAKLDAVLSLLNGSSDQEPIASKAVIGLEEIYPSLAKGASGERITVDATITDWSRIADPYPAYFGLIDGYQLKDWWSKYGKRLVAKNIRHALGATDVNDGIKETAESSPENFWYFNNGITLIADEALRAPAAAASRAAGNFQFKGASIVNGAQTVSTLAGVVGAEELGKVRVPIRVVLLKDAPEGFGAEVTRTNNLQNRVEGRDFVSQDPEQRRLQEEMSVEGVEYQVSRSTDVVKSLYACELIEATTALACASGDPTLAVQVKTGIGRFFNDLKKPPYKAVFNPSLTGAKVFNSILVQREIDQWIDAKKLGLEKRSGYQWGVLIHGNRVLAAGIFKLIGAHNLERPIEEFRKTLLTLQIDVISDKVHAAMVDILDSDFPGKFLAVLFKSPTSSKHVFDLALAKAAS